MILLPLTFNFIYGTSILFPVYIFSGTPQGIKLGSSVEMTEVDMNTVIRISQSKCNSKT